MNPKNTNPNQSFQAKATYRFLGGIAVGLLILVIPVTYGALNDFGAVQAGASILLVLLCGLLSICWGNQFVDVVTRMLNSTGL